MGDVDAARLGDGLAYLDELGRVAPGLGVVREARRQADRALLHALADEPLGMLEAVAGHRHVLEAAGLQPQCAVGDQVRGVDGGRAAVGLAECRHAAGVQPLGRVAQDAAQVASVDSVVVGGQGAV